MKNNKKYIIIPIVIAVIIIASVVGLIVYKKSNQLTIEEKDWLASQTEKNAVININVLNNANIFGYSGDGVFYEFVNSFAEKYSLNINKVAIKYGSKNNGVTLGVKKSVNKNDEVFYTDHYVLVGRDFKKVISVDDIKGKKIGMLASDSNIVNKYLASYNLTLQSYSGKEELLKSLSENDYIIVPLNYYLDSILSNNFKVAYHFSDIKVYYTLSGDGDILNSILKKYYSSWQNNFKEIYNDELFELMTGELNISATDIDNMQNKTYRYGFINNSPYEVISNGNYGGILSIYLKDFTDFADINYKFTKYSNLMKFNRALVKKEIDVYFGYYNIDSEFNKTESGIGVTYSVIANSKNDIVVNSLDSLNGKTVYVDSNSYLYTYLKNNNKNINIETYDNVKELLKLNRKDKIIVIDSYIFDYYQDHGLDNYTRRYNNVINDFYTINVSTNDTMYKLMNSYVNITDSHEVINKGIYNHEKTVSKGFVFTFIAKYFIYLISVFLLIMVFVTWKSRKVTIAKKIKKDDTLRFIDQLTLLKNRNYLKENIASWANNTIYPQAVIVVDLNKLQQINDIEGYEQGDKQIKAAANALIKTQLDNSEIIRTDGNEFVIYLVGYAQKQITNYIHKLNKEFNKLPYKYGAEFGYSMIIDDIKTIEDALNEATILLKKQKEIVNESENKN